MVRHAKYLIRIKIMFHLIYRRFMLRIISLSHTAVTLKSIRNEVRGSDDFAIYASLRRYIDREASGDASNACDAEHCGRLSVALGFRPAARLAMVSPKPRKRSEADTPTSSD